MSVYVGPSLYPFGRMLMCHMVADSVDELHEMADSINLPRRHFQSEGLPHYDISKSKRSIAVKSGAIEVDEKTIAKIARECYDNAH